MSEEKKKEYTSGMFSNCSFVDSVVVGIAEEGSTVSYGKPNEEKKVSKEQASKDTIMEYVGRLRSFVRDEYQERYDEIWMGILDLSEVSKRVFDKGKQQDTTFNLNLVAQIIHQVSDWLYVPAANAVKMAEYLEPGRGAEHSVRQKLGESPDREVKKAIELYLKGQQ